ncbi:MAG TPA: hypothetical protein PLD10_26165 [Rhodopila sp.]|nr:hypothetical protein [Rhodopila sp.]
MFPRFPDMQRLRSFLALKTLLILASEQRRTPPFRLSHAMVALGLILAVPAVARAGAVTISFSAVIGSVNNIDSGNIFQEGSNANLAGQTIGGVAVINPSTLTERCVAGGACYADNGAGAISIRFTLNGIAQSVISTGTLGYFGNSSGGSISISDPAHGGYNYLSVGVTSPDGLLQESIGALFNAATLFSAYGTNAAGAAGVQTNVGSPNAGAAIASLAAIGGGVGLVAGGITLMTPIEHIDATITGITVPEPVSLALLVPALVAMRCARRRRFACSRRHR